MRLRNPLLFILGALLTCTSVMAMADTPAATVTAGPTDGDVTMTVIPNGQDVVKTVVQTITVPANANKIAKGKSTNQHEATPATSRNNEAAEQAAQRLAEETAEHQATQAQQQAQQVQQQAQNASKPRQPPPPPPPGSSGG